MGEIHFQRCMGEILFQRMGEIHFQGEIHFSQRVGDIHFIQGEIHLQHMGDLR